MAKKKRGRPTKKESQAKALTVTAEHDPWIGYTDAEVLKAVHDRFDVMDSLTHGSTKGDVRSLIISGAPGIAKTYTVEKILNETKEKNPNFIFNVIKGNISPVNLYMYLHDNSAYGNVTVLDDADSIFFEGSGDGIAILKAALDSTPVRTIHWHSETSAFKKDGEVVYNKSFDYNGTMIFITNTDFQGIIDEGRSRLVPHLEALMSRSMYLDLAVHNRRAIAIWVNYLIQQKNILVYHYGVSKTQQKQAVDWLLDNRDTVRTLSIRDAMKIGQMMAAEGSDWERTAEILLLKTDM